MKNIFKSLLFLLLTAIMFGTLMICPSAVMHGRDASSDSPSVSDVIPNISETDTGTANTSGTPGTMMPGTNIPQDTGSQPGVIGTTSPTTTGGTSGNMDNNTASKVIGVIIAVIAVIAVIILIVALVPKRRK